MSKELLFHVIGNRPIAYHPEIAKSVGSVHAGVFLSQLLYWSDRGRDPDGWIYKTRSEFYEETGLTRYNQETARKDLVSAGVLIEKKKGSPPTLHYKVDFDALFSILSKRLESNRLNGGNPTNQTGGIQPFKRLENNLSSLTENTTKTTTKTTTKGVEVFGPALSEYHKKTGQVVTYSMIHKPVVTLVVEHGLDLEQIAASISAYAQEKREGRFRHNLSTFLRDPLKVSKYLSQEPAKETAEDLDRKLEILRGKK